MRHSLLISLVVALFIISILLCFSPTSSFVECKEQQQPTVKRFIVASNTSKYKYRHMTTIAQINSTFFVMFWQTSTIGEGHDDQSIMMSKSYTQGTSWSEEEEVVVSHDATNPNLKVPIWGPAPLWVEKQQKLYLYFSESVPQNTRPFGCKGTKLCRHFPGGKIRFVTTQDFKTFSPKQTIFEYDSDKEINGYVYGNVSKMTANKPIFTSADEQSWSLPIWCEPHFPANPNDTGKQVAALAVTTDGGRTHTIESHIAKQGLPESWLIENTVFPIDRLAVDAASASSSTVLQQLFRTQVGWIMTSVSKKNTNNSFSSWSAATNTMTPNPDSKTSACSMYSTQTAWKKDRPIQFALTCNPTWFSRRKLSLYLGSLETGVDAVTRVHFHEHLVDLEDNLKYDSDYPTTVQGAGSNFIIVTYTCFSHTAACVSFIKY